MSINNDRRFEFRAYFGDKNVTVRISQINGMGTPWAFDVSYITEEHHGHIIKRAHGEWIGPRWFTKEDIDAIGERIEEYFKAQLK